MNAETVTIEVPAYVGQKIKAVAHSVGGMTEGQVVETFLEGLPLANLFECVRDAWQWTDERELARLNEAEALARDCNGDEDEFIERANQSPKFRP